MSTTRTQTVDHERLLQKLVVHACRIMKVFGPEAKTVIVDGVGKSPTDFACDTLILFLDGKVDCTGDEAGICACLRRVLERDILDALRSSAARTTEKVQPVSGTKSKAGEPQAGLDDYRSRDDTAALVDADSFKQRFYQALEKEEPELFDLVYAVFEENALKPREIAEVLGCDPSEVQNRKKRLRTFIAKHNLMTILTKVTA